MFILPVLILLCSQAAYSLRNGQAITPPMILTTRSQGCAFNQQTIKQQAQYLLASGLYSKGYQYILIEDCWQIRDSQGLLQSDPSKFSRPMDIFVYQLHQMGFKIGVGTDIGSTTRLGRPGSAGYEAKDVNTFSYWKIDYVWISNSGNLSGSRSRFITISQLLQQTKSPIMISIDNAGGEGVATWGATVANTWKTVPDFKTNWILLLAAIDKQTGLEKYSGQGAWNYPSSLRPDLPINQFMSQYVMWIALKSPLVLQASNNTFTKQQLAFLLNEELLSVHQDSLKRQACLMRSEIYQGGKQQIWGGLLSNNRLLLVFLNGLEKAGPMQINLRQEAGVDDISAYWLRDPIAHETLGSSSNQVLKVAKVQGHGVAVRIVNF